MVIKDFLEILKYFFVKNKLIGFVLSKSNCRLILRYVSLLFLKLYLTLALMNSSKCILL